MLIKALEQSEMCSVIFIRDYLQFYLEGETHTCTLTTYSMPVSVVGGQTYESGMSGYRDSLCSFISQKVMISEVIGNEKINLIFESNDRLEVPLRKEESLGQEAAMLRVDNQIAVW